ncbi:hypothetical protein PMIN07_010139 [Paraphaeosphaeria minitans]
MPKAKPKSVARSKIPKKSEASTKLKPATKSDAPRKLEARTRSKALKIPKTLEKAKAVPEIKPPATSGRVFFHEPSDEHGFLSPWYTSHFSIKDEDYESSGQYILAEKARAFGDKKARQRILEEHDTDILKFLGKTIKGIDEKSWRRRASRITKSANMHKFLSDDAESRDLLRQLKNLGTGELIFADPADSVLGIGFSAAEATEVGHAQWGDNVFGKAIEEVRNTKAWKDQKASHQRDFDTSIFDVGGRLSVYW